MEKTLLLSFTDTNQPSDNSDALTCSDDGKELADLVQEMKPHLLNASKDLLQPRSEMITALLKKISG